MITAQVLDKREGQKKGAWASFCGKGKEGCDCSTGSTLHYFVAGCLYRLVGDHLSIARPIRIDDAVHAEQKSLGP